MVHCYASTIFRLAPRDEFEEWKYWKFETWLLVVRLINLNSWSLFYLYLTRMTTYLIKTELVFLSWFLVSLLVIWFSPVLSKTLLLLSRPGTSCTHKLMSYLQVGAHPQSLARNFAWLRLSEASISPLVYSASQSTTSNGDANSGTRIIIIIIIIMVLAQDYNLGWLEYHLPDAPNE